jgi:hypothetical protein
LESAVNLNKSEPAQTSTPAPTVLPMQPEQPQNNGYQQTGYSQQNTNTYGTNSNYAQMPNYPQSANVNNERTENMSVGQWVLTTFLASLGIVGLILLFIWAFGDTPQPKKNYARGMLIWWAIAAGITILFVVGSCVCAGSLVSGLGDLDYYGYY